MTTLPDFPKITCLSPRPRCPIHSLDCKSFTVSLNSLISQSCSPHFRFNFTGSFYQFPSKYTTLLRLFECPGFLSFSRLCAITEFNCDHKKHDQPLLLSTSRRALHVFSTKGIYRRACFKTRAGLNFWLCRTTYYQNIHW